METQSELQFRNHKEVLSPKSEFEVCELVVFEFEIILQLLNDHRVRLAHLLLPLVFTTHTHTTHIISTRMNTIYLLYNSQTHTYSSDSHTGPKVNTTLTLSCYLYMSEMVLICNFPLMSFFSSIAGRTRVQQQHNRSLSHNRTVPDKGGSCPRAKNKHLWVEWPTTTTTDLPPNTSEYASVWLCVSVYIYIQYKAKQVTSFLHCPS